MNAADTYLADANVMGQMQSIAIEIADDYARSDIECKALGVISTYPHPVYDVSAVEVGPINEPELIDAYRADVERAVRYLDLRGQLVRPFEGRPQFVSFGRQA
jgi:hypothetical protein